MRIQLNVDVIKNEQVGETGLNVTECLKFLIVFSVRQYFSTIRASNAAQFQKGFSTTKSLHYIEKFF